MKSVLFSVIVLVAVSMNPVTTTAADQWKIGLSRTKITPSKPVRLAGYASRKDPYTEVIADLYAKALLLEDAEGNRGLIITCDLIGMNADLTDSICNDIIAETKLTRSQILLNFSHIHSGPIVLSESAEVDWPEEQIKVTREYTRQLKTKLVQLATDATKTLQPAKLSWAVGLATFPINRREFTARGVRLGENPRGLVDRSVPVIKIESPDGSPLCLLYGTACHNTTLGPKHLHVSGDFAGYSQQFLESKFDGVQAMFVQNCGGDANPFPRDAESLARHHGETLGAEVQRVLTKELQPIESSLATVLESVAIPVASTPSKKEIQQLIDRGSWQGWVGEEMQKEIVKSGELPAAYNAPIGVWQFGDDLTFVALPGEVVVGYVELLERAIDPRNLWVSAYNNDVFGYLPTARVLEEGGYETRGIYSRGIGFFSPNAQDVVVEKVTDLATKAGRKLNATN